MRLINVKEIPIEAWEQTCGDIGNFVGKNIINELCKGIADIIANGGEYIIHMTDKEITSSPMTNSMRYQREIQYEPLVRCKDCKWYKDFDGCFFSTAECEPEHFCSWAEREEK